MSVESADVPASVGLWRRRNLAEMKIRQAIQNQPGLSIFGIGLDRSRGSGGEFFVTLTAADFEARQKAPRLLGKYSGLSKADWSRGWRRLDLGDWMIRVYPEHSQD